MSENKMAPATIRLSTAMLLGVILFLAQLLITQWTVKASGNRDVIDYISFSGTLTSMLLAVLAIVYSYFTTASQKNDADRIATQIGALAGTARTLDQSESRLSEELQKLADFRAKLDEVGLRVEESGERSKGVQLVLEEMRANQEEARELARAKAQERRDDREDDPDSDKSEGGVGEVSHDMFFVKRLASQATSQQIVMLYAAYVSSDEALPVRKVIQREVEPYFRPDKKTSFILDAAYGEIFAYTMIYIDLGFGIEKEVENAFLKALGARLEKASPADYEDSQFEQSTLVPYLNLKGQELVRKAGLAGE